MPFYEVQHNTTLTASQKAELAEAITTIHSAKFTTPKLFVNVGFKDVSQSDLFVGGKPHRANHLNAHVRNGPMRRREDWVQLTDEIQQAWTKIVSPGLPKVRRSDPDEDTSLRSVVFLGDIIHGQELGFTIPPAGGDIQWLNDNWEEFNKRADEGDEDFRFMVDEVKERGLLQSNGASAKEKLEEALGWGDSA